MATALIYVLVLLVVAALFFLGASVLFGRGEELAPLPPGASPTWLPADDVAGADVRAVRFQQAVRGYRMAEVDWVLDRLAGELDRVAAERDELRRWLDRLATPAEPVESVAPAEPVERVEAGPESDGEHAGTTEPVGPARDDVPVPDEARDVSEERTEA
jgi:DivIVA domain-containing protein